MIRFTSLGSGSKGNALLVQCQKTILLIDCGFGLQETEKRLHLRSLDPTLISAILVTHEHGDHANGVGKLSRKYRIPVHCTVGTYLSIKNNQFFNFNPFHSHEPFALGDLWVEPYPVPHDSREACQFTLTNGCSRLGLLTDIGHITPHMRQQLAELDGLLLEFNYDSEMLLNGRYHASLKHRVKGQYGHLSNEQAHEFLVQLNQSKLQHVVGMHLSENNNRIELVKASMAQALNCQTQEVLVASQNNGFDWLTLAHHR